MPAPSRPVPPHLIVRRRRARREAPRRQSQSRRSRWAYGLGTLVSLVASVLLLLVAFGYADLTHDLPSSEQMLTLFDPSSGLLLEPARLYDRSGAYLLATIAPPGFDDTPRRFLTYQEFPPALVDATLALMQPGFWSSPGYILAGWEDPYSHPTLAQQLVYTYLLVDESPTSRRAVRERLLAAQITAQYGRQQVLAWVLNSLDYGNHAYGAEAAAQLYLGKSVTELTLSECALLAGIGATPALNPHDSLQAAESNRLDVLGAMLTLGWITPEQALAAQVDLPVIVPPAEPPPSLVSPQFTALVLRHLDPVLGAGRVVRGGVKIRTSIDYTLQLQVDCAMRTQLARLSGDMTEILVGDGSSCQAAALLPVLTGQEAGAQDVTAGVLVMDPASGEVLAAAGDLSSQPAGTSITPFVYMTAFSRGLNPASLGWDVPGDEPVLGQVYQGPVRLRVALANDYLPPARTLVDQMGMENVRLIAASFGLDFPSTGLLEQDFSVSPFDLASAYAVLASAGVQTGRDLDSLGPASTLPQGLEPVSVLYVTTPADVLWLDWSTPQQRLVVTPELAYLLNDVLGDETVRSASLGRTDPLDIGRPAAVKLGRTLDETGTWTLGYTPQRLVLVRLSGAVSSSRAAEGLWNALARFSVRDLPASPWAMPAGIVTLKVCDPSGMLPTDACPNVVDEIFLDGRQPVQYDTLYQTLEINIETNLLATVYTPPDLVESRVYLVAPPSARQWAQAAGIDSPPTTYDYFKMPDILPQVHITTPAMFSDGRAVLDVRGTAAGDDFSFYRLEYGAGLNPSNWFLLDADSFQPVTEGLLGRWDTTGLEGLYTLRLMVVRTDDRVEEALVQVTLDNTPPQILILYPQEGDVLSQADSAYISLLADVQDAFLSQVVFYVDGVKVGTAESAPYGAIWQVKKGSHILRLFATDRAGNTSQQELRFTVEK